MKGQRNADEKQGATPRPVGQKSEGGAEIRGRDTEGQEAAREDEAEKLRAWQEKDMSHYVHVEGTPEHPPGEWTSSESFIDTDPGKLPWWRRILGWRKVLCVVLLAGIGVAMELFAKSGLSANMLELLKWLGISYLGANAIKGGMEGWRR